MTAGAGNSSRDIADSAPPIEISVAHKVTMLVVVVLPLLGCAAAALWMWRYGWTGWFYVWLALGGWVVTGLGITIGYHRLLAHRSFETSRWVRGLWAALGALAVEGTPQDWCAVHRKHHQFSDDDGDPHTPHGHDGGLWRAARGFAHAHTGWIFGEPFADPNRHRYVPDLTADPFLASIDRNYHWWLLASLAIPAAVAGAVAGSWTGALLGFLWGGLVRVFLTLHIAWSINSICHLFGTRPFRTRDRSRNNFALGLLAHGEGWHNNHHAFPTSARHGLRWWEIDLSWTIIWLMERLGLVWNVRTPSADDVRAKLRSPRSS